MYREQSQKGKEWKKKAKKKEEVIHIEFDMDDDEKVQMRNAKDRITEGKARTKKMIHYYEFCSEDVFSS